MLIALVGSAASAADLTPVKPIEVSRDGGLPNVVLVQSATGETLMLLPEHCFFSGEGGAKLGGEKSSTDELNGNKAWDRIEGLKSPGQRIVWPLWLHAGGEITGKVFAEGGGGKLTFQLGDETQSVNASKSGAAFHFTKGKAGRVDLVMSPGAGFKGAVLCVDLAGAGMKGAQLLRARWRPAAQHSGFASSSLASGGAPSRLWVMEVRPVFGEKSFYSPITTPFGYFGSTFNPDHTSGGINFSMWSYSAGAKEPPLPQLSHLLAVGSPKASFGGFGHEGTGVKLRGWNPYEGQKIETTVLALRLDPGTPYDTYTGYFLDQATRTWRLYASGRKWVGTKGVTSLLPACFVEVPGPPQVERSGHIMRAADFRGWVRDAKGKWHPVDEMHGSKQDAAREQTNSLWSTTDDGWFRMGMGGMVHYRYTKGADLKAPPAKKLPDYLAPERLKEIDQMPTLVVIKNASRRGATVTAELDIRTIAKGTSKVRAVYGSEDALSFEDRWAKKKDLGELPAGVQRITLPDAPATGFCRIFVTNETGQTITVEPGAWK